MKKIEMLNELRNRFEFDQSRLEDFPPNIEIKHLSTGCIFLPENTFEENQRTLHQLRAAMGSYTLVHYYMSSERLALGYNFEKGDVDVVMFCTDAEDALEQVGKGKCHIAPMERAPELEVVCEV